MSLLSPPLLPPFCRRLFLLKPPFCCLFLMAFLAPCCQSPKWVLTGLWATGEAQRRAFPSLQWSHCGFQQCTNWRRQLSTTNTQVQFAHSSIQITGKWVRPRTHSSHTHSHGPAKITAILISIVQLPNIRSHPFSKFMLAVKGNSEGDSNCEEGETRTGCSACPDGLEIP